jgi:hypothetical protein
MSDPTYKPPPFKSSRYSLPGLDQTDLALTGYDLGNYKATGPDYSGVQKQADQMAHNTEMLRLLGTAGAVGMPATPKRKAPTAQDHRNNEQLAALEHAEATNTLGLSGDESNLLWQNQMNPVRTLATQARNEHEALHATVGGSRSAADMNRAADREQRQLQTSAQQAGMNISTAHLQRKAQQIQELEERTAYKAKRQAQRRDAFASFLTKLGGMGGEYLAAQTPDRLNVQPMIDAGYSPEDISSYLDQMKKARTKKSREELYDLYRGNTPRNDTA